LVRLPLSFSIPEPVPRFRTARTALEAVRVIFPPTSRIPVPSKVRSAILPFVPPPVIDTLPDTVSVDPVATCRLVVPVEEGAVMVMDAQDAEAFNTTACPLEIVTLLVVRGAEVAFPQNKPLYTSQVDEEVQFPLCLLL